MAKTFLFERSFNVNTNFLSWASATPGAGSFDGVDDPSQLTYIGFDDIRAPDDFVIIPVAIFAGQEITIDVDFGAKPGDDSIDLRAIVINASGAAVTQDDSGTSDLGSVSNLDPNFKFTATKTGVYFLALTDWQNNYAGEFEFENDGTGVGSFQVNISTRDQFGIINYGNNDDNVLNFAADALDDRIVALGGSDTITTGDGRNVVDAGDDNDFVYGGSDSDQVFGDLGNDLLHGGAGDDVLIGGGGDDTIRGGLGADQMVAGGGIDTVDFSDLNFGVRLDLAELDAQQTSRTVFEIIHGFENAIGSRGADVIFGNAARDNRLEGGAGNDSLDGRGADDTLIGGSGADTLRGGAGADTFLFQSVQEMGRGRVTADVIADFRHQVDVINLRAVDAIPRTAANNEFAFIGARQFSDTAGELRVATVGGRTELQMDMNGDGRADYVIQFTGRVTLTAGDFLL